ncbi:MAG TPA: hypothetical protein VGE72_06290 [Azospirillum sp.]
MSLGRYDSERRYRRRALAGFAKVTLVLSVLLGVGLFAHRMGMEQVKSRDAILREEVATLSSQKEQLQLVATQMQHAARTAEARTAEMEARLRAEVPTGELAKLTKIVAERLKAGVDPTRLAFVIRETENPRNCQQPESKRLVLATPLLKTASRSLGFANNAITVVGEGQSARNPQGQPESWFDPGQPVKIRIIALGGKETVVAGVLPLHQSVVVDRNEYRFNFTAGPRSFVEVTADRCPFP